MAIYASLVHGLDLELWGAFGFSHERVRDNLARELRDGDYVLSIGTMGEPTPEGLRGKLLALMKLGRRQVSTEQYVEYNHWQNHLHENGGVPRWPYALPIVSAEVFKEPLPDKNMVLPRFKEANLHMKLASNYERLLPEEEERVLKLERTPAPLIYQGTTGTFQANLLNRKPGPPPSLRTRTLNPQSGPAATYLMILEGDLASKMTNGTQGAVIVKGGYSNDPDRRCAEVNCHLPDAARLRWTLDLTQWHRDEINAYAMEQEFFRQLQREGFKDMKGEIYVGDPRRLRTAWTSALRQAVRPSGDVRVPIPPHEGTQP